MPVQVNRLKQGERFKIHPGDDRGYVFQENRYACSPKDHPETTEFFAGTKQVYKVEL